MTEVASTVKRYVVTQKELKEKLGLEGDIQQIGLWYGRSPLSVEKGVSADTESYYIDTLITKEEKEKEKEKEKPGKK